MSVEDYTDRYPLPEGYSLKVVIDEEVWWITDGDNTIYIDDDGNLVTKTLTERAVWPAAIIIAAFAYRPPWVF